MLEFILLGMVLEQDRTGYEMKKAIEHGIGVFYKASYGSLYPALKKLAGKGLLLALEKPQGGRQKTYYHLTEAGKDTFFQWLSAPMDIFEGTNSHLARVYFFDHLPPKTRAQQLLEHENNNTAYLQKLLALERKYQNLEEREQHYYKLSTLYYGICITQKSIQWCRHVRLQQPLADLIEND